MRNRTRPAIVCLMLRKHFEIAGWAAEHYQSLVVSTSSERYPSQMVLWELCLSLKLQTLSSSTLCGDQWLILGRTLQSYANLSPYCLSCLGDIVTILAEFSEKRHLGTAGVQITAPPHSLSIHISWTWILQHQRHRHFLFLPSYSHFSSHIGFLYWVHTHPILALIKVSWDVQSKGRQIT